MANGMEFIRKDVAEYIAKRDECEIPSIERIFLTDGASGSIFMILCCLIRNEKDGIIVPIPQYPLYSAAITLFGGTQLYYYLDEEKEWEVNIDDLEKDYIDSIKRGIIPRVMVSVNPGNPTGSVLNRKVMERIIKFCCQKKIVLIADEVYQENIHCEQTKWFSFNKVTHDLGKEYVDNLQLVSLHSVSKGFFGECGRRGGFMVLSEGFESEVIDEVRKRANIHTCPNLDGQLVVDLMVKPPKKGDESYDLFVKEKNEIVNSLKKKSIKLSEALDKIPKISCNMSKGAMYCFPQIYLPKKAIKEAEKHNLEPDMFYCVKLLNETGICTVPGGYLSFQNDISTSW